LIDEEMRLDELRRYDVLDSGSEPAFDHLVELAALSCGAPIALITLVDETRQWFKAEHGVAVRETPREVSFCTHALRGNALLVVEDLTQDERFATNPFVTGPEGVRFYAGAPLVTRRGFALGTLCVLDRQPRRLSADGARALSLLRDQVMLLLENRRELIELRRSEGLRQEAVEALLATKIDLERRIELRTRELEHSARRLSEAQSVAHVGSWEWSVAEDRVVWSEEMYRIYGVTPVEFAGSYESFLSHVHPDDLEHTKATVADAYRHPKRFTYDHRIVRTDGEVRLLHTVGEAVADASGRVLRMVGSCWDTTEQWQAAQQLGRAGAALQTLLDAAPEGVLIVDEHGRLLTVNRRCAEIFDLPPDLAAPQADAAPLLQHIAERLDDGAPFLARVRQARAQPDAVFVDTFHPAGGGPVPCASRPYRTDGGIGRVWTFG
jgi:PAS domain S-box-containing protein